MAGYHLLHLRAFRAFILKCEQIAGSSFQLFLQVLNSFFSKF